MPKLWRFRTQSNNSSRVDSNPTQHTKLQTSSTFQKNNSIPSHETQPYDVKTKPISKVLKHGIVAMLFRTILRPLGTSLTWISHLLPFTIRTGALVITQTILARPSRWNFLQVVIATASTGFPFLNVFRPFFLPLLATWVYGLSTKFIAPAHARSLHFWKRVVPIYVGYKRTQIALNFTNSLPYTRAKRWNKRHEWGASKVCSSIFSFCIIE